jgi:hypothetical protein
VLIDALKSRVANPSKPPERWHLMDLLDFALQEQWIQADVHKLTNVLREYRNLIHPTAQVKLRDVPDKDPVDVWWPVINAALNDLAASAWDGCCGMDVDAIRCDGPDDTTGT